MPELPEVETIKRQLAKMIVGKTIAEIDVLNNKSFIGKKEEVRGKKISALKRFGKMIQIIVSGDKDLLIHLKMTGQLIYVTSKNGKRQTEKSTRVIITFTDKSQLYFNDNRKFGWVKVVDDEDIKRHNKKLGLEPFTDNFTREGLSMLVEQSKKPIKSLIMDQEKISGMGNIYANEALFLAKIRPARTAESLTSSEIKSLYNSILSVLEEGIAHEGSSVKDRGYISAMGEYGRHQDYLKVYQREGEKCFECGGIIEKTVVGGRGTFFCRKCQK